MNNELKTKLRKLLDEYRLSEISVCNKLWSEPSEDEKVIEIAAAIAKLENEPVVEIDPAFPQTHLLKDAK